MSFERGDRENSKYPRYIKQLYPSLISEIREEIFDAQLIIDRIFLGSIEAAFNVKRMRDNGIKFILSVGTHILDFVDSIDENYAFIEEHAVLRIEDSSDEFLLKHLLSCIDFIDDCLVRADGNLLIHCVAGASRSASIVIAYLITRKGWRYADALSFVKGKRSLVCPNEGFEMQLKILERFEGDILKANQFCQDNFGIYQDLQLVLKI